MPMKSSSVPPAAGISTLVGASAEDACRDREDREDRHVAAANGL